MWCLFGVYCKEPEKIAMASFFLTVYDFVRECSPHLLDILSNGFLYVIGQESEGVVGRVRIFKNFTWWRYGL